MPSPSTRHLYSSSSGQTRGARQARTSDESDATTSKASNERDARNIRDHFAEAVRGAYWPQKGVMAAKEEDISEDIPETDRCKFNEDLFWLKKSDRLLQSKRGDAKRGENVETNLSWELYVSERRAAMRRGGAPWCPCTASGEGTWSTWSPPSWSWPSSASTPPGTSASAASGRAGGWTPGCSSLGAMERRLEREWKQRDFENAQCQAKS